MTNRRSRPRTRFEGQRLISELLNHLSRGDPLSSDDRERWVTCLGGLLFARNRNQVADLLIKRLNLEFRTGHPEIDFSSKIMRIYRVEWTILEKKTKKEAIKEVADELRLSDEALHNEYYGFQKRHREDIEFIRAYAQSRLANGQDIGDGGFLSLEIAWQRQVRMRARE